MSRSLKNHAFGIMSDSRNLCRPMALTKECGEKHRHSGNKDFPPRALLLLCFSLVACCVRLACSVRGGAEARRGEDEMRARRGRAGERRKWRALHARHGTRVGWGGVGRNGRSRGEEGDARRLLSSRSRARRLPDPSSHSSMRRGPPQQIRTTRESQRRWVSTSSGPSSRRHRVIAHQKEKGGLRLALISCMHVKADEGRQSHATHEDEGIISCSPSPLASLVLRPSNHIFVLYSYVLLLRIAFFYIYIYIKKYRKKTNERVHSARVAMDLSADVKAW